MRHSVSGPRKVTTRQHAVVIDGIMALEAEVRADPEAEFTSGAQVGVDTISAHAACTIFPLMRLTVPERCLYNEKLVEMGEAAGWEIVRVPWAGSAADTYLRRNDVTIYNYSEIHHTFPGTAEEQVRSGTWSAVRRARRKGIEIRFIPLDGSAPWIEPAEAGHLFT